MRYVFVYGTLRAGEANDIDHVAARHGIAAPTLLGAAALPGELYDFGTYPGMIAGAAGQRRDDRSARAGEREQRDPVQVEAERRLREPQPDGRPERAERSHRERGGQRMPAEHGFVGEQAAHRCEQRAIASRHRRHARRQPQCEYARDRRVRARGQRVERTPAGSARDQAGERPR